MKTQADEYNELQELSNEFAILIKAGVVPESETVKNIASRMDNLQRQYFMSSPFRVGKTYTLMNGETTIIVGVCNRGTEYETIVDQHGVHRYSTRDFGRNTGGNHMNFDRYIDLSKIDMKGFEYPHWWKTIQNEEENPSDRYERYEPFSFGTMDESCKEIPIRIFSRDGDTLLVEYVNRLDDNRPRTMMYMGEHRDIYPSDRFWVSVDKVEFTGCSSYKKRVFKECNSGQ